MCFCFFLLYIICKRNFEIIKTQRHTIRKILIDLGGRNVRYYPEKGRHRHIFSGLKKTIRKSEKTTRKT